MSAAQVARPQRWHRSIIGLVEVYPPRAARSAASAARVGIAVLVIATVGLGGAASAEPSARRSHVTRVLAAVRALGADGRDRLDRAIYTAARTECQAGATAPPVGCLITVARAACAADPDRARCEAAADVIVTNLRAAGDLVDEATRFRLVRGSTDYRAALAAELRQRHAVLAAELVLAGAGDATGGAAGDRDAAAIDQLCAHRDREIHACRLGDPVCVPSLPWSRCVAALVWFVGGGP